MNEPKAFYFPSSVAMIDDNDAFLTNLSLRMSDFFSVNTFVDPNEAVLFITKNYSTNVLSDIQSIVKKGDDAENDYPFYIIDFDRISQIHNNSDRVNICSALVVDYSMPIMSGITFCEKLAEIPIPKIMLTGHVDFQLAVDAFNKGLINQFVVKDSPNMYENLLQAVMKCQDEFFQLKSYPIMNAVQLTENTMLGSDDYFECFRHILSRYSIIEYYLLDSYGTFLLIAGDGRKYYFQSVSNQQIEECINIAENASGDADLISTMREGFMLPLFTSETDRQLPVSEWRCLLQPVSKQESISYILFESPA